MYIFKAGMLATGHCSYILLSNSKNIPQVTKRSLSSDKNHG